MSLLTAAMPVAPRGGMQDFADVLADEDVAEAPVASPEHGVSWHVDSARPMAQERIDIVAPHETAVDPVATKLAGWHVAVPQPELLAELPGIASSPAEEPWQGRAAPTSHHSGGEQPVAGEETPKRRRGEAAPAIGDNERRSRAPWPHVNVAGAAQRFFEPEHKDVPPIAAQFDQIRREAPVPVDDAGLRERRDAPSAHPEVPPVPVETAEFQQPRDGADTQRHDFASSVPVGFNAPAQQPRDIADTPVGFSTQAQQPRDVADTQRYDFVSFVPVGFSTQARPPRDVPPARVDAPNIEYTQKHDVLYAPSAAAEYTRPGIRAVVPAGDRLDTRSVPRPHVDVPADGSPEPQRRSSSTDEDKPQDGVDPIEFTGGVQQRRHAPTGFVAESFGKPAGQAATAGREVQVPMGAGLETRSRPGVLPHWDSFQAEPAHAQPPRPGEPEVRLGSTPELDMPRAEVRPEQASPRRGAQPFASSALVTAFETAAPHAEHVAFTGTVERSIHPVADPHPIEFMHRVRAPVEVAEQPQTPVRTLTVTVEQQAGADRTDIHFTHRNGAVDMVVRSSSPETARALRNDLPELVRSLEEHGFHSELDDSGRDHDGRPKRQYERTDDDD